MAITMLCNETIDRVSLIKTISSHEGWILGAVLTDNKTRNPAEMDVGIYIIEIIMDKRIFHVAYQPKINELTIIGSDNEMEQQVKQKIGDIIERKKIGHLPRTDIILYQNQLLQNGRFMTKEELDQALKESNDLRNNSYAYIH